VHLPEFAACQASQAGRAGQAPGAGRQEGRVHDGHARDDGEHGEDDGLGEHAPQPAALHEADKGDDQQLCDLHRQVPLSRAAGSAAQAQGWRGTAAGGGPGRSRPG